MKSIYIAAIAAIFSLPAAAKPIQEVDAGDGAVIQLHADGAGLCTGSARYAEYIPKDPTQKVRGCWTLGGPFVLIVFLDGDTAKVPAMAFKDVKEA